LLGSGYADAGLACGEVQDLQLGQRSEITLLASFTRGALMPNSVRLK
jgi:hypothetical protein